MYSNHSLCSAACRTGGTLLEHEECTEFHCLQSSGLGCYWGRYTCPQRVENFDLNLRHKFRYCQYSMAGDLVSTNFSPIYPGHSGLTDNIHSVLNDVVVDPRITTTQQQCSMIPMLPDFNETAQICAFTQGDGTCAAGSGCSDKMVAGTNDVGAYVGPTDAQGQPMGGVYPRNPDPRPGIWTAEACAEWVAESEPSANGATWSGLTNELDQTLLRPFCFAEFGMQFSDANAEIPNAHWSTCFLQPTDNMFLTSIASASGAVVPALSAANGNLHLQIQDEEAICSHYR